MRKEIEKEFVNFIRMIEIYTTEIGTIHFLYQIQNSFLQLQSKQIGRLKKIPVMQNNSYAPIDDLMAKHGFSDILSCIYSGKTTVCLEIFGLSPNALPHT